MQPAMRAGSIAVVVALFVAGCSTSSKTQPSLPTVASPTTASAAVSARQSLEFRQVNLILGASTAIKAEGGSSFKPQRCSTLVTPVAELRPTNPSEMLFDRRRAYCYLLGPTLVSGSSVDTATLNYDAPTATWAVNVHFDNNDFLTKIARPLVNKRVAVVLTGYVQSVMTIKAGLTGRNVEIIGGFTQVGAADVAAAILGVAPSSVPVQGGS
jgi:preprotein translocase subunit SecD